MVDGSRKQGRKQGSAADRSTLQIRSRAISGGKRDDGRPTVQSPGSGARASGKGSRVKAQMAGDEEKNDQQKTGVVRIAVDVVVMENECLLRGKWMANRWASLAGNRKRLASGQNSSPFVKRLFGAFFELTKHATPSHTCPPRHGLARFCALCNWTEPVFARSSDSASHKHPGRARPSTTHHLPLFSDH